MTRIVAIPGSFDLFTNGHLWLVQEAAKLANSKVVVLIAHNPNKQGMFTIAERIDMIEVACKEAGLSHVDVQVNDNEYTASWAQENEARMLRGIRNAADLEYERMVNITNTNLGTEQTLFVLPPENIGMISSSYVKSLIGPIGWHQPVKKFLPPYCYDKLIEKWLTKEWDNAISTLRTLVWPSRSDSDVRDNLFKQYESNDRFYHTKTHLVQCISELQRASLTDSERAKLVLAILYHDAIQGPMGEQSSAAQILVDLHNIVEYDVAVEISSIVLATDHKQRNETLTDLEDTMISVDLSILGRPEAEYQQYAANVRKEYQQYTDVEYAEGRCKVLESMIELAKADKLYPDVVFQWKYGDRARWNMIHEMNELKKLLPVVDDNTIPF